MKKSKKVLGITIGLSIILIGIGITYYALIRRDNKEIAKMKQNLENRLTLEDKVYEYGSEIKLQELNLDDNVKVYINSQELNGTYKFTEVGEYKLKAEMSQTYKRFLNKEEIITANKEVIINVEDNNKPTIDGVSDKEITEGDNIDLKQGITARDEIDGNLEVIIEGEVDTNKVGEYEIKVKATDKNNNTTEVTYKVKVNAKTEEVVKSDNLSSSNQSTQSHTNKSSNSINSKSTKDKKTYTANKIISNDNGYNKTNNTTESDSNKSDEHTTYQGTTDGTRYYFQDRGENGNYEETFSW